MARQSRAWRREIAVSADNIEYVVKLREDVKWQDGVAFGADDILYTMSLLSDPDYSAFSPAGRFWQTVEVQKLSDLLVRFRLAQPLGSFTSLLTVGIVPEHALRGTTVNDLVHHPFNLSPIGTGPYQLGALHTDATGNNRRRTLLQKAPTFDDRRENGGETGFGELRLGIYASADHAIDAYRANQVDVLANIGQRGQLLSLPSSRVYTGVESSLDHSNLQLGGTIFSGSPRTPRICLGLEPASTVGAAFGRQCNFRRQSICFRFGCISAQCVLVQLRPSFGRIFPGSCIRRQIGNGRQQRCR